METLATSIPDAQKALGGISRATVYRLVKTGRLELIKIGTRSAITTKSQRALVEAA